MDRTQVLKKIRAMMAIRDNSTFEGEAQAAALLIDKLCAQYGITGADLGTKHSGAKIFAEVFISGRTRAYDKLLLLAVAQFYDSHVFTQGASLNVVGSEAQHIQVRLYFDFIKECMEREARKAYEAEHVLSELNGRRAPGRDYLHTFKVAFTSTVKQRLVDMKAEANRTHEDALACATYWGTEFGNLRTRQVGSVRHNAGLEAGLQAGREASLSRQLR